MQEINLSNQELEHSDVGHMLTVLPTNSCVTKIDLSYNKFSNLEIFKLDWESLFKMKKSIMEIDLSGNELNDNFAEVISGILDQQQDVKTHFNLSGNRISEENLRRIEDLTTRNRGISAPSTAVSGVTASPVAAVDRQNVNR